MKERYNEKENKTGRNKKCIKIGIKEKTELPDEEIHYEPEYIPKNQTVDNEINKLSKSEFSKKFNDIFINKVKINEPDETEKLNWFREETTKYQELKHSKDIHSTFDNIRSNKSGMVLYNNEYRPLYGGVSRIGGNSFYDEKETDENGYITCNPFDKLKYDDITRVHRDQVIIPIDNEEFIRAKKERIIDEYKKEPKFTMIQKEDATRILEEKLKEYDNKIMEKKHNLEKKIATYETLNESIISQFMMLN